MTTSELLANRTWSDTVGGDLGAQRAETERLQHEKERHQAARVVAAAALDTADARDLLSMLGLGPDDIRAALGRHTVAA